MVCNNKCMSKLPFKKHVYVTYPTKSPFFKILSPVNIFCQVIRGAFDVTANGGNGHKGQDGSPGADARDSDDVVRTLFIVWTINVTGETVA